MTTPTLIISRSDVEDARRRAFEDAVLRALEAAGRCPLLVVPPLYSLIEGDAALEALRAVKGHLVIGSWLHPRAAYWVLHARGVRGGATGGDDCEECCASENCFCGDRKMVVHNLATLESADAAARRLLAQVPRRPSRSAGVREVAGEPRSPWHPVIDYSLCAVCGQCHDFCLFGVYTTNDANEPQVASPENCKPGCAACARICPQGAIMFPLYAGDEGIAGAPGKRPKAAPIVPEAFFRRGEACPVCGCACDCERSQDGTAPPGKTVCPACGCLCDATGPCACRPRRVVRTSPATPPRGDQPRDELDDLIDELDRLDA